MKASMIRFGVFELDLVAGELCKSGRRVHLQDQPLQVLSALVDRPGQIVTREELRTKLWAADTYVDFDTGLNRCVKKIREALGDSAESPRFVETIPKRGYRFIASVDRSGPGGECDGPAAIPTSARRYSGVFIAALGTLAVALAFMTWRWAVASPQIKSVAVLPLENLSADASDEYFAEGVTDEIITQLAQTDSVSVISRTSVAQYRHTKKSLRVIAQELKADAIVSIFQSRNEPEKQL
jgi:DNA-binding winged helix-turn-helix (wHTH) protein